MRFLSTKMLIAFFLMAGMLSCKDQEKKEDQDLASETKAADGQPFFKISLAQWSLHKQLFSGELDPMDFARKASEMGFEGIEYVSAFYAEKINNAGDPETAMQETLDSLKANSQQYNVRNVLIMVDGEGDLASPEATAREQAVENHKKWVDAAEFLGCHSIRVNLFGTQDEQEWKKAAADGLSKLTEYAAQKDINVLVENHGSLSSNAALLVEVMEDVDMEHCGTLPDFGNFCLKREGDQQWEASCVEEYPKYQGVEEMMPYAKAVSAKSYDFNEKGQETTLDYARFLKIVKDAGYTGYIGVEYEGEDPEEEGITRTRELLIAEGSKLHNVSQQ